MNNDHETLQPPPPPRSATSLDARLGLWVQSSPDAARWGQFVDMANVVAMTLGRGADATLVLHDTWLSRQHVRISLVATAKRGKGPWLLEDLGTRNGTFINGRRVERALLQLGDTIRIGATLFVFDQGVLGDQADGIVGLSLAISQIRQQIRDLARTDRPVHVTGESGVGKEVVANALHALSRRDGPFLAVNMATIVSGLAESQLFGHRRGAFSGAISDQIGAFDVASGGTLLLDEMAELDIGLQAKLLRAVEGNEIHRIGDAKPHNVDVRLITATNRDLAEMAFDGSFRADLYWRIGHNCIEVAPLRLRRLDIAPLVDHFLAQTGTPSLLSLTALQPKVAWQIADLLECYLTHPWPGNVRELRDEVSCLADAMRARQRSDVSGPIPPLEEAVSERLRQPPIMTTPYVERRISGSHAIDPNRSQHYATLLDDPAQLRQAIQDEAAGNIKAFAERAAVALGKNPASLRRHIYRQLGAGVNNLRAGDKA